MDLLEEFVIPKCDARAFPLLQGQRLRVIAHEGKQVADLKFINLHDHKEQFAAYWSVLLNATEGTNVGQQITKLWSKRPTRG